MGDSYLIYQYEYDPMNDKLAITFDPTGKIVGSGTPDQQKISSDLAFADWNNVLSWFCYSQKGLRAQDVINAGYHQYGGWKPFTGFQMSPGGILRYPGDPDLYPLWRLDWGPTDDIHQEVYGYKFGWVAIVEPLTSVFEVCRID